MKEKPFLASLEPDPLRFSDFPIMVVGWGFATVKRGSGRKSLWTHTFRMLLCKHYIKTGNARKSAPMPWSGSGDEKTS